MKTRLITAALVTLVSSTTLADTLRYSTTISAVLRTILAIFAAQVAL